MLKHTRHRATLLGCILATTVALGCQLPQAPGVGQPRAVVDYGTLDFRNDADLAIVLDYRALLKDGYKIQQAASTGQLQKITARVVGKNMPFEQTVEVDCTQVSNGLATLSFTQLPPGPVDIYINAVDDQGKTIAYATGSAVIKPNQTARVTLTCSTATGSLTIEFDCPGLSGCGGTPTPSPTPTPTPELPPRDPVTDKAIGATTGFAVDSAGIVYLFGPDPSTNLSSRIIKVENNSYTVMDDDNAGSHEGEIRGNILSTVDWNSIRRLDLSTGQVVVAPRPANHKAASPWRANTINPAGSIIYNQKTSPLDSSCILWDETSTGSSFYSYNGLHTNGGKFSPLSMSYDVVSNRLLWACDAGIASLDYGTSLSGTAPNVLLEMSGGAYGLETVDDNGSRILYTRPGDQNVYLHSFSNQSTTVAFTPLFGNPFRIEKSSDGYFYLMLFKETVGPIEVTPQPSSARWSKLFRVIKLRFNGATNSLDPVTVKIDTMPNEPASF